MIKITPKILKKEKREQFAILSIEDYNSLMKYIEDLEDLLDLRNARQESKGESSYTIDETRKILEIEKR